MAQQGEGNAPLRAIARDGGRFLIEPNDGADARDEIASFEAHGIAAREVSALRWLGRRRQRCLVRIQLNRRAVIRDRLIDFFFAVTDSSARK